MKKLLLSLLCIALLLCGCSSSSKSPSPDATPDAAPAKASEPPIAAPTDPPTDPPTDLPTQPPTDPPTPEEAAQKRLGAILSAEGHASGGSVKVPEIYQYPDLPTGCEAAAAAIAINSLGYDLSAVDFARDWLIRGDDIVRSFVGDPFAYGGAGIFPPGLRDSVQRYIDASKAQLAVFDVTGVPADALYRLIDCGVPVVVWSTYYMNDPWIGSSYTYDGHTVYWYDNEHCVCLYGYDAQTGSVLISDPIQGKVRESAAAFESIYDQIGRMAIVILDTSALSEE